MSAYIIVEVKIENPVEYENYKALTPASLIPFGGEFIVRGALSESLEGDWNPERIVVLRFPNKEQAKAWWNSDLYADAKAIRQRTAKTKMLVIEGI